jgi:hypothetical protein
MTSSAQTNFCTAGVESWSGSKRFSGTSRGSAGGTLTRAKWRSPVFGSRTCTARFRLRLEMWGNGRLGSEASGVRTGKISRSK